MILLNIAGIVAYFTGPFFLLVIGAIFGAINKFLLKGAPYPKLLILIIAFVISIILMYLTKNPPFNTLLLLLCLDPILSHISGFFVSKDLR